MVVAFLCPLQEKKLDNSLKKLVVQRTYGQLRA